MALVDDKTGRESRECRDAGRSPASGNTLTLAVEPVAAFPAADGRAWSGGGARVHIEVDGVDLRALASRAARMEGAASMGFFSIERPAGAFPYWLASGCATRQGYLQWADRVTVLTHARNTDDGSYVARIRPDADPVVWNGVTDVWPRQWSHDELPARASTGPFSFHRASYLATVASARALFDAMAIDVSRLATDPEHRQYNDALRRLRHVEAAMKAAQLPEEVRAVMAEPVTTLVARIHASLAVQRLLGVDDEVAREFVTGWPQGSMPGDLQFDEERRRIVEELAARFRELAADGARPQIEGHTPWR